MSLERVRLTKKQREILRIIFESVDRGDYINLQDLKSKLSYGAEITHQALEFSLRILLRRDFITKFYIKDGKLTTEYVPGQKMTLAPSAKAYHLDRGSL